MGGMKIRRDGMTDGRTMDTSMTMRSHIYCKCLQMSAHHDREASVFPNRYKTFRFKASCEVDRSAEDEQFTPLRAVLSNMPAYEPLDLTGFQPDSAVERKQWYSRLQHGQFQFPLEILRHQQGGQMSDKVICWRASDDLGDALQQHDQAVTKSMALCNVYQPRSACRKFVKKFRQLSPKQLQSPAALGAVHHELTNDSAKVPENVRKVIEALGEDGALEHLFDGRKLNGSVETRFEPFWDAAAKYFQANMHLLGCDDRRHGDKCGEDVLHLASGEERAFLAGQWPVTNSRILYLHLRNVSSSTLPCIFQMQRTYPSEP